MRSKERTVEIGRDRVDSWIKIVNAFGGQSLIEPLH